MAPRKPPDPELAARVAELRERIAERARETGRDGDAITLVAVTKFHPPELVTDLAALGVRDIGESRHPEAAQKSAAVAEPSLRWHFVGQLQSNKARLVRAYADVIHSLDRPSLLRVLEGPDEPVSVFVQVNLTDDPGRGGVAPGELGVMVERVLAAPGLRLLGLMAVAGRDAEPGREFARVRELRDRVVLPLAPGAGSLSMGMSGDWPDAVAEGATHLRIGTAITGNRPIAA